MLSTKNQGTVLSVLLSAGLLVSACGGGGGGGTSTTAATSKASSAATKSIVSTVGAGGAGIDAGSAKPSLKGTASGAENDATLMRKGIENLKARMQGGGGRQKAMMAVTGPTVPCDNAGGTEENLVDDKDTPDPSDDKFITIYTNCRTNKEPGLDKLKNGRVEDSFAGGLFSSSFSGLDPADTTKGFEESEIDTTSGNRVIKFESTKGTVVMTGGSFVDCGTEFFAQNAVLTMNMTVEEKEDEDATVGFEKHELFTANNFTMKITDNFNPSPACTFISEVIVLSGTTSFEDKLNPNSDDNYTAAFTDFTVTITDREDANGVFLGEEVALSGSVTITSPCANGTYTVASATTTPLFFPDGAACPVEGRIDVSGGGSTSLVVVNPDGSVDFDDNNNGTIENDGDGIPEPGEDKHFDTCDDADVCHT